MRLIAWLREMENIASDVWYHHFARAARSQSGAPTPLGKGAQPPLHPCSWPRVGRPKGGAPVARGERMNISPVSAQKPSRKPPNRGVRGGRVDQNMVSLRLSAAERATLRERANDAGLSVGSYLRLKALGSTGARSVPKPPIERELAAHLLAQLRRVGGNVNQIAKAANMGEVVMREDLAPTLAAVRSLVNDLAAALGRAPP